jgi:3-oxoacyl-[acyl-carrier protein] reductase
MTADVLSAGPEKIGAKAYDDMLRISQIGDRSLKLAAKLCLFLAGEKGDGITGRLISAPWDAWKELSEYRDELAASDIYTLRRIVPRDRGKSWGVAK